MTGYIIGILIALGLYGFIAWKLQIFPFTKVYKYQNYFLPVNWPETFAMYKYTEKGVNCNFEDPITEEQWARISPIIDMGVSNCIQGYKPEWTKKRNHGDFRIGFIKPTATNMDGSPALLVSGIQTAGTVLGAGSSSFAPPTICLPQQANWDYLSYLMHSVWFEGEHDAECANDRGLFYQYAVAGDVHPHRPIDNPEMPMLPVSLVGKSAVQFQCGIYEH